MAATLVVCAENQALIDKEFFSTFGAKIIIAATPQVLLNYLKNARPHGIILIWPGSLLTTMPTWLMEIERRAHFEGLRVALLIKMNAEGMQWLRDDLARLRVSSLLSFRDVIAIKPNIGNEKDKAYLRERLGIGLSLEQNHNYNGDMSLIVKKKGKIKASFPARISWFDEEGHILVETSIRMKENTPCVMRVFGVGGATAELKAVCLENSFSDLRFNFGMSAKLSVFEKHAQWLRKAILSHEKAEKICHGKPFRRALVVIKNAEIRDRVVRILASHMVEARVPLVWKNVPQDCKRMNPHFIIIEDSVLDPLGLKLGPTLKELSSWIGPHAKICFLGPRADILAKFVTAAEAAMAFTEAEALDSSLETLIRMSDKTNANNQQYWIYPDSAWGKCMLEIEENYVAVANNGIIIESPHGYRSLCNVFFDFNLGAPFVIAKNMGTFLVSDAWRTVHKQREAMEELTRYNFMFNTANPGYYKEFNTFLREEVDYFQETIINKITPPLSPPTALETLAGTTEEESAKDEPETKKPDYEEEDEEDSFLVLRKKLQELLAGAWKAAKKDNVAFILVCLGLVIFVYVLIKLLPSDGADFFSNSFSELFYGPKRR